MQPYAPRSGAVLSAVRLHGGKILSSFDDALLDGGDDVLHRDDGIHLDAILVEGFPDGGLFARALLLTVDGDDHRLDVHLRFFFELGQDDDALDNLWAYTDQMNAINQTVNQAGDYLGWEFTDVSDEDTADDQTAKVEGCVNEGEVYADWNAGGIAGAMAPENDLDTLTSVEFYGEKSLHLYGQMRAVLLNCTNSAPVYAGKQNAGGTGILVLAAGAGILLARRRKRKTTV